MIPDRETSFPGAADEIARASGSAVDAVLAQIRQMIVEGGLKVGDKLPTERELCERFASSRNTVREAMRMLKAFGVVEVRPKVGATIVDQRMNRAFDLFSFNVTEISRQTFDDIQGFRELIETGSVTQIFAAIQPSDLSDLREINREMVRAKSVIEASEHDLRFHTRLVSIIGNKSILDIYRIMTPVILRIMQRGKTRRTIEGETFREHEAILDAAERRDALAFQYLMRTHLRAGLWTFEDG
ncbi:FadR/GntR family transcriptional regulator [Tabrizicola flagellatus]|uniref:FadR/GntR family transcriptional regulator n=1 Tax=Tabrizicola flagellatus TaxID=2593021 RepID=UPI0011F21208|nr:FadR/GntR family transcriptional regulator [Tabrizicola flagellatus]